MFSYSFCCLLTAHFSVVCIGAHLYTRTHTHSNVSSLFPFSWWYDSFGCWFTASLSLRSLNRPFLAVVRFSLLLLLILWKFIHTVNSFTVHAIRCILCELNSVVYASRAPNLIGGKTLSTTKIVCVFFFSSFSYVNKNKPELLWY